MYGKALLAVLVSAVGALVTALGTGATDISDIDTKHWLIAAGVVLTSGGLVAIVDNITGVLGGAVKAIIAFLSAGVGSLVIALDDNVISQAEYLTAFSVAVVATGLVYKATGK